ncbi:MAG: hypothetical protein WBH68_07420 [Erysipelotrichaceae bacterium]
MNIAIKKQRQIFAFILVMIIGIIYCSSKRIITMDEPLSFSLSNEASLYHPGWVLIKEHGWMLKDNFTGYGVTHVPFNYSQVIINQAADVHPPLYYILMHTICSFFPYRLSIWFGLGINYLFYLMNAIIIYITSKKIIKNELISILIMLLYSINFQVLEMLNFIRMYMMVSFFVLLFVFSAYKLICDNKNEKMNIVLLFISTVGGGLTHYFFYVAIISICLPIAVYLLIKRKYKLLLTSASIVIIACLLNVFIFFPATIEHVFTTNQSNHSSTIINNFINMGIDYNRFNTFINFTFFKGIGFYSGLVLIFINMILYVKNKDKNILFLILIFISYYINFYIAQKTATYIQPRYIYPMEIVGLLCYLTSVFIISKQYKFIILKILFLLFITFKNLNINNIVYSLKLVPSWEIAKANQYGVAVFLTDGTATVGINFLDLRWYHAVGTTSIYEPFSNEIDKNFICYIQKTLDKTEAISYLRQQIDKEFIIEKINNTDTLEFDLYMVLINN